MMADILDDLRDLHKQATTERSHYYVAKTTERAIAEIESLRRQLFEGLARVVVDAKRNDDLIRDAKRRLDAAGL